MTNIIQKNIMRRVYYSYTLSLVTSVALWQGIVLGACVALFGRLTHVASIWNNLSHTAITQMPAFIAEAFLNALKSGEVTTALIVVVMLTLSASFAYQTAKLFRLLSTFRIA
jgi:hypothetical protein